MITVATPWIWRKVQSDQGGVLDVTLTQLTGETFNGGNDMPLPAENLTPDSSAADIRLAISESIKKCMEEGRPQDQCAAMAYDMARKATGKSIGKEA